MAAAHSPRQARSIISQPSRKPSAIEPVSPMNTLAGCQFQNRYPAVAEAMISARTCSGLTATATAITRT